MAATTSFARNASGMLVYAKTGRAVPAKRAAELEIRGTTVYNTKTGRKAGQTAQRSFNVKQQRKVNRSPLRVQQRREGAAAKRKATIAQRKSSEPYVPRTTRRATSTPNPTKPIEPTIRDLNPEWTRGRVRAFKQIARDNTDDPALKKRISKLTPDHLQRLQDMGLNPELSQVYDYYENDYFTEVQSLYNANLNFLLSQVGL